MKNVLYKDQDFKKLLQPGNKVRLTNLWNKDSVPKEVTIKGFDGCEFTVDDDGYNNIGHSGFIVESDTIFYTCFNANPFCKVEILERQ